MTTNGKLALDEIVAAFGSAKSGVPGVALEQAAERWSEFRSPFLALFEAAVHKTDTSDSCYRVLSYAIWVMTQVRECQAFPLLCAAASDEKLSDAIFLRDAFTEDLPAMLARTYDGKSR